MTARTQLRSLIATVILVLVLAGVLSHTGRVLARHYPAVAALEALFLHHADSSVR